MQVSNMYGWSSYGGVANTMTTIWRTEGVRGFFRGNSATVARIMPYAAVQYSAFEFYNRKLAEHIFSSESKSPAKRFIAGSLAGTTSVLLTYPIDLARTILAVQIGSRTAAPSSGLWRTLVHVFTTNGVAGLYKGVYPTVVGVVPYSGISFLTYGVLKRVADTNALSERRPVATSLICGGSAGLSTYCSTPTAAKLSCSVLFCFPIATEIDSLPGVFNFFAISLYVVAQCCTYPLDMVRRRLQALHSPSKMSAQERAFLRVSRSGYSRRLFHFSIYRAIMFIVRKEGLAGLYRGVSLNFLKTAPAMSISFTCYDRLRNWLGVPAGKYSATTG
jgi:hypothetical protein